MATLERTKSFLQARENFSEKNFKEEYETSQREVKLLKTKLETSNKKLEDLKANMDHKLHQVQEERKAEQEKFETLKNEYEAHIASMENIMHFQENEQARLNEEIHECEEDASEYMDEIDDLKKQLKNQSIDVDNLQLENQKLYDLTVILQNESIKLQEALDVSEENLNVHKSLVKEKLASTVDEFTAQMNEGNRKNAEKDEMIYSLGQELESAEAENQRLKATLSTTQHQVASLEALLLEQEKDHIHMKTHYSSHGDSISKLSLELTQYKEQLTAKSKVLTETESKNEKLTKLARESADEIIKYQSQIKDLEAQLKEVQQKSVADRTSLSNKLLAALDDWNDRIAFVNQQLVQKDETIASQKKQLDAKLSELYNVRQELNKLKGGSGSTLTSPSKPSEASSQDSPPLPTKELSNSWANLKSQLTDYQSTLASNTAPVVATQLISSPSSHDLKRHLSKWTLNGLKNGQPSRAPSQLEEESSLPSGPTPHYAQSKNEVLLGTPTSTPSKKPSMANLITPTNKEKLHKAQSMLLAPRSGSPSRVKSPERTRSTVNLNSAETKYNYAFGSSVGTNRHGLNTSFESENSGRSRSPARLSRGASVGANQLR